MKRLRWWKKACQSRASFLSVHGTCQTAAPGKLTVGYPACLARRPYSESSHLMKKGRLRPISRTTLERDQAHEPGLKSTSTRRCNQRALRRLRAPKSQSGPTVDGDIHQKR